MSRRLLVALALGVAAVGAGAARPLIIAHRGASGERPEHTIAAYRLAIAEGADFIEPDLVMTRDGVMVARHENEISGTTDVASHPEFAARRTTETIDGTSISGWFTEDFTLTELKTLRARERLPDIRPAVAKAYDGRFAVPTLDEILDLVSREDKATGRRIGIYPEIKHSTYFRGIGLAMEDRLVAKLAAAGYVKASDPVFIQSFEVDNLKALRRVTKLRLIQLIDDSGAPYDRIAAGDRVTTYAAMTTPSGLNAIARYADAIGPAKGLIVPRDVAGRSLAPTALVADAHRAGLLVHPWTFRSENDFLPAELRRGASPAATGDAAAEYRQFFALGVDGLFSEFPRAAAAARANPRSTSN